ncbi:conserved Plasmodium protein, unknown function [Plasmodium gallinaceum]|uniref:Uncharacterized protein n=1 Tax=Plasmodium gallinaceum TaxID=5849 RepID=A0A1J1GYS1_PLAGA|nr:conserved Plasmodium protein, unknown function [Plasmodium gallinaceum]CRG97463.1 conserved Plasmodium protein, unknown function [Plasmodium gallinaceum]
MLTLISVCTYLFYANKDYILNLVGLNNDENENKEENTTDVKTKLKNEKIRKALTEEISLSDSDLNRKKIILRTYSDVDFNIKTRNKNFRN